MERMSGEEGERGVERWGGKEREGGNGDRRAGRQVGMEGGGRERRLGRERIGDEEWQRAKRGEG
jgi:hypothetical protein